MTRTLTFAVFLLVVSAVAATGAAFQPGAWYDTLIKPAWTPPDIAFPIVWTLLYIFIAIAGARAWLAAGPGQRALPFGVYALQLAANAAWSWLFFGRHLILWGLVDIVLLLGLIIANVMVFWRLDRIAAGLLIPYGLWVLYAATLNGGILILNS